MRRRSPESGFTVIEAVIAVSIASMALFLAVTIYGASFTSYRTQHLKSAVSRSTELGMEYLTKDIRATNQVLASYDTVATSSSAIALRVPSYDSSGVISGSYDYITYTLNRRDKRLVRSVAASAGSRTSEANRILARNVEGIDIVYECRNVFDGNGATQTFTISHSWTENPSARVDGVLLENGYSLNADTRTITFSGAPSSGSVVEVLYPVSPSDASALADVYMVVVELTCRNTEADEDEASTLDATIRLRNKR